MAGITAPFVALLFLALGDRNGSRLIRPYDDVEADAQSGTGKVNSNTGHGPTRLPQFKDQARTMLHPTSEFLVTDNTGLGCNDIPIVSVMAVPVIPDTGDDQRPHLEPRYFCDHFM
jgi:hypothetical protein